MHRSPPSWWCKRRSTVAGCRWRWPTSRRQSRWVSLWGRRQRCRERESRWKVTRGFITHFYVCLTRCRWLTVTSSLCFPSRAEPSDPSKRDSVRWRSPLVQTESLAQCENCPILTHHIHGSTALSDTVCVDDVQYPAQHTRVWQIHNRQTIVV